MIRRDQARRPVRRRFAMILLKDALAQARRERGLTQEEPAACPYNGGDDQEPRTAHGPEHGPVRG